MYYDVQCTASKDSFEKIDMLGNPANILAVLKKLANHDTILKHLG